MLIHHHTAKENYEQLTTAPIPGVITRLAIPTIISMLVTAFYNMADTYFVGKINTQSTAAVGIVFSLMSIIQATGFFFGHGSGNFISRRLGARDVDSAEKMAATGFFMAFFMGCLLAVLGLIFLTPLSVMLGSTPTILPYTERYLGIILIGTPFMASSLVLNNQMRFQGNAAYAMVGIVSGAVLNVLLDPLFIFVCDMGVAGAALATVMGTCLTVLILCTHFFSKENHLKLAGGFSLKRAFAVASNGLASFILEMSGGFVTFIFNRQLLAYVGETGVVVYSIISNAALVVKSISNGIAQAAQPLISTNYGAGEHGRVGEARSLGIRISLFAGVLFTAIGLLFPVPLSYLFLDPSDEVLSMAVPAIRLYFIAFIPAAWNIMCGTYFQAVVKPQLALANTLLRGIILNSLFVFLLPVFFGVEGIWVTVAVSEALTAAVVFWLMKKETN